MGTLTMDESNGDGLVEWFIIMGGAMMFGRFGALVSFGSLIFWSQRLAA